MYWPGGNFIPNKPPIVLTATYSSRGKEEAKKLPKSEIMVSTAKK